MDIKVEHSLQIIQQAIDDYENVAIACSFGKDSLVILDLARRIKPDIPVFAVMTPYKPKETFDFMQKVRKDWNLNLKVYVTKTLLIRKFEVQDISDDVNSYLSKPIIAPLDLYRINPDECCRIFKVLPTIEAVKDLDAWICGLRRDEGSTRHNCQEFEKRGDLVKVNPILDWSEADVWKYHAINNLPIHLWYNEGYRSLGCAPCSMPNTETERGGRWFFSKEKRGKECGIHSRVLRGRNKGKCVNEICKP